jgi:hypothetical protein
VSQAQAPAPSKLICYDAPTQIGVAARRDFQNERGLVVKSIFYTSMESAGAHIPCAEGTLRVHSVRTFEHDPAGRVVVETHAKGESVSPFEHWRLDYVGNAEQPVRRTLYTTGGKRTYEIRDAGDGESVHIHFDRRERVVGIMGSVPTDLSLGFEWGPEIDGWRCAVAVRDDGEGPLPQINVHLLNESGRETSARFARYLETELRDDQGAIVPLTAGFLSEQSRDTGDSWEGRLLGPGEAAYRSHRLADRYGSLPPGRYSLLVRHPHPTARALLVSSSVSFEVGSSRQPR